MLSTIEAETFVKNVHPASFLYHYEIGGKCGTRYSICINTETIASIYRPYVHPLSRDEFIKFVWNQARFKIMHEMLKKLES